MQPAAFSPTEVLREHGLRATPGRVQLLNILFKESVPVSIEHLRKKLKGALNEVTLYRTLERFAKENIVARSDFRHGHAHYELMLGRPHHHHAVCSDCGMIEDIEISHVSEPTKEAQKHAKGFDRIEAYALEFFGVCKSCA